MAVTSANKPSDGLNIEAYRGDTFLRWLRIKRNGVEEDLSTSNFKMQIRIGMTILQELTTEASGGLVIDSPNNGVLKMTVAPTLAQNWEPGTYTYDLQQTTATGLVVTRVRGSFTVTDDITK